MVFVVLVIGLVLVVAAVRNSQASLFSALMSDVPAFAVWAAAIFALSAIGFVPDLKPVSRGLLVLVLVVIVLTNYKQILSGFQSAWQGAQGQATDAGTAAGAQAASTNGLQVFDLAHIEDALASAAGGVSTLAPFALPGGF